MKKLIVDESFWKILPDVKIGVLAVDGICETAELSEAQAAEVKALLDGANEAAKRFLTSGVISENQVVAVWRQAYQKFPTKKGARCSIEALLKRVLLAKPVGTIAPSVDITNTISLKYALPIGAEDLDAIAGDLRLGTMAGGEDFLPIGGDKQEPPLAGEIAYYDEKGAVCRCWNWRDGQRTSVKDETTREVIVMECVEPERAAALAAAIDELEGLMQKYLGAKVLAKAIISSENREVVLQS